MLPSLPFDHRELAIFLYHGRGACHLQKAGLQRRAKRRIALKDNCKMALWIRFPPWYCRRINPVLIAKDRIRNRKRFTAFEQQRIDKRNSRPDTCHVSFTQMVFYAFQIAAGNPRHAVALSAIAER